MTDYEVLRVTLGAEVRAAIEAEAFDARIPASHHAGRILSDALGVEWRRPLSLPLRSQYEPLIDNSSRSVVLLLPLETASRLRSEADSLGLSVAWRAAEILYGHAGAEFTRRLGRRRRPAKRPRKAPGGREGTSAAPMPSSRF